jgi:hypothetical protein
VPNKDGHESKQDTYQSANSRRLKEGATLAFERGEFGKRHKVKMP